MFRLERAPAFVLLCQPGMQITAPNRPQTSVRTCSGCSRTLDRDRTIATLVLGLTVSLAGFACGPGEDGADGDAFDEASLSTPVSGPGAFTIPRFMGSPTSTQRSVFTSNKSRLSSSSCNSVAFAQLSPGGDMFLGRELTAGGCAGTTWSLTLARLTNGTIQKVARILDTSTPIPVPGTSSSITTAYDPSTVVFGGQRWVAFECHGVGFGPMAASCAGALSDDGRTVDRNRLSILVDGGNANASDWSNVYSASVPKLLVHQGRLYLYWTALHARSNGPWIDITTRGIELEVKSTGRLGIKGRGSAIKPNDPSSVEVWGLVDNDNRQNSVADAFQIYSDGQSVYAIAAVGGWNKASFPGYQTRSPGDSRESLMCIHPESPVTGCYRLAIARSNSPLERRGFNSTDPTRRVADAVLPANPQEYTRLFTYSNGTPALMGMYKAQHGTPDAGKADMGEGMWVFTLPLPATATTVNQLITHYYTSILGRNPDSGGLAYWAGQVSAKMTLGLDAKPVFRDIAFGFLTSAEYTSKRTTNTEFVTTLYRTFFRRAPDAGGLNYWVGRLSSGATRASVMQGFVNSQEFTNYMLGLGF
ncbi:MAG: DUF4214 domain-containing protein [Deltaproteobacteria bacterium]|nr:DUF4214 domain-containing protein [Deltaproteobacteria bacterium]